MGDEKEMGRRFKKSQKEEVKVLDWLASLVGVPSKVEVEEFDNIPAMTLDQIEALLFGEKET